MEVEKQELNDILNKLQNIHYPCGPLYTKSHKIAALNSMQNNELEAVYNLVESHTPCLRFHAVHRYEKSLESQENVTPLSKDHINFKCSVTSVDDKIKNMIKQLDELPKEWTLIQLTSQFNIKESLEINSENFYTSPLHVTVLDCGRGRADPFTIILDPPVDQISGKNIEIRQEMHSILQDSMKLFNNYKAFIGNGGTLRCDNQTYADKRYKLNCRLESLIKQVQQKWLGAWRCLLIGKYTDYAIEKLISSAIDDALKSNECPDISEKHKKLLKQLVKVGEKLDTIELKRAIKYIFPEDKDKNIILDLAKTITKMSKKFRCAGQQRHPVILIVDEKLDFLPWEMLDVLLDHPVSRMPSLHFAYALFKEHEDSIVNGLKVNVDSKNGTYLVNPDLNLKNMEIRLKGFYKYWIPDWTGSIGVRPSEHDFKNMITNSSIFVYNGHGNGSQFLASDKIQKIKVNAVVLLFGCNSVTLTSLGPQVEMHSGYQMYLIACSPCILGTLWPVTDVETDLVTTEFLSQWIPSSAPIHWKLINKSIWEVTGKCNPEGKKGVVSESEKHEPELLRALCKARKAARQYLMKAAFVVRGLPVRLDDSEN